MIHEILSLDEIDLIAKESLSNRTTTHRSLGERSGRKPAVTGGGPPKKPIVIDEQEWEASRNRSFGFMPSQLSFTI